MTATQADVAPVYLAPLVSVIIPTFNRARLIKRALDSVVAQNFKNYEVIVVDDGSTDNLAFVATYPGLAHVRLIRHPENRGAAASRNTGITAATGRFVAFLDSDDCWHPDKLSCQVTVLRSAASNVGACLTGYILHKGDRELTICPQLSPGRFKTEILFGCTISPGTTLLINRSVFDQIGLFDENLRRLEDWDWLLRFAEVYDIVFIPKPLATVYVSAWEEHSIPDEADLVLQALRRMAMKHLPQFRARGRLRLRQFRSTLFLETAARMYRKRQPVRAFGYVFASLWVYPFRNIAFFGTLWRSAMSLMRK
jgi:glycosyltransferase involved in cell wall biosynthesis